MSGSERLAAALAGQDWKDGASYDDNPFQQGTAEHDAWQREMNALMANEIQREMMEPQL